MYSSKTSSLLHVTGNFDPEVNPELKKTPDRSKISIRRNFRKPHISRSEPKKCYQEISRNFENDSESQTLDPEQFH